MTTLDEISPKKVTTISKYLDLLNGIETEDSMLFRGQSNSEWPLTSTAYRRLLINRNSISIDQNIFIEYNKDLLERAKLNGYGKKESRQLTDLELLAEIQHYEGATCLIDFSRSFLIAMWFASAVPVVNGAGLYVDGVIYIIHSKKNKEKYLRISSNEIDKNIDNILKFETRVDDSNLKTNMPVLKPPNYKYWIWEPEGLNNRILQQDSSFVFGKPLIDKDDYTKILIDKDDKKSVQYELTTFFNICSDTLFKDLPGFASKVQSVNNGWFSNDPKDIRQISKNIFRRGESYYEQKEYGKALEEFNDAIKLNSEDFEYFVMRGRVLDQLERFQESIEDYKKAERSLPALDIDMDIYNLLGSAYLNLHDHINAEKWYNKSLEVFPMDYYAYIGLGYIHFEKGEYPKSIEKYNESFKNAYPESIGSIHAYIAQSEGKQGNYERMIKEFKLAFSTDYNEININLDTLEASIMSGNKEAFIKFKDEINKTHKLNIYPSIFLFLNAVGDYFFFNQSFNESLIVKEIEKELLSSPTLLQWSLKELKNWLLLEENLLPENKQVLMSLITKAEDLLERPKEL